MKTELPEPSDCYWKIIDAIISATTWYHIIGCINLVDNFTNLFPDQDYRSMILEVILTKSIQYAQL